MIKSLPLRRADGLPLWRRANLSHGNATTLALASIAALVVLCAMLVGLGAAPAERAAGESLLVYCAVGLKPAVEPAAKQFEQDFGIPIQLQYGPSGGLEAQIELSGRGDLFIPAAEQPYLTRGRRDGAVREILPLVQMRLVVALNATCNAPIASVRELIDSGVRFAIANPQAAVGLRTKECLERAGVWPAVNDAAKAALPTVNETAEAIRLGVGVEAGIVWDAAARQYGLKIVDAPELQDGRSIVSVGVLATSKTHDKARQFAEFLASDDAAPFFEREHYEMIK